MNVLNKNTSYGVCWDNVQVDPHTKHQGRERTNPFLMWGMTFGVSNRVPSLHLSKTDQIRATQVPVSAYVPSGAEYQQLRNHMEHIVVQVLSRNLDCLEHLRFAKHPAHIHSEEMGTKSNVVSKFSLIAH